MASVKPDEAAAYSLLSAQAVRERAQRHAGDRPRRQAAELPRSIFGQARRARSSWCWRRRARPIPTLDVPFHSRWRHFVAGWRGPLDRNRRGGKPWRDRAARARAEFDLAIVSVLLDAGAGAQWRYRDPVSGAEIGRSEGLALASLATVRAAARSRRHPSDPLRADADALQGTDGRRRWPPAFRSRPTIRWSASKAAPICCAGSATVVAAQPEIFAIGDTPRPGGLFDRLACARRGRRPARARRSWSSSCTTSARSGRRGSRSAALPLGDCWRHPSLVTEDATSGLVPLHKLSQWLAYSLIEPLQTAGIAVTDIDGLTGLAEYRNGGLFVDTGVLALRDPADAAREHDVASPLVVEWRALTVALLDRLADGLRQRLEARCGIAAACQGARRRHLGGRPGDRARAAGRRLAAGQGRQRRHGVLNQQTANERSGGNHARRHDRRSSAGPAQAHADPRQGHLDQIVPRAAQGDRACCSATR